MGLLVMLSILLFMVFVAFSVGYLDGPTTYRMMGTGLDVLFEEPTREMRTAIARTAPQPIQRHVTPLVKKRVAARQN